MSCPSTDRSPAVRVASRSAPRRARCNAAWRTLAMLSAAACGGTGTEGDQAGAAFEVLDIEFRAHPNPPDRSATSPVFIEHLGVDGAGRPVVVGEGEVHVLRGSHFERRRLFVRPGDPPSLGVVHALAPRAPDGAWIAAEAGLFAVEGAYVVALGPSLDGLPETPVVDVLEVPEGGALSGLWLVTPEALLRALDAETARYEIPDLSGSLEALAIEGRGRRGLALGGGEVRLIEPSGPSLAISRLPFDPGEVRGIAATQDAIWVAGELGLFVSDGVRWRRIDLMRNPMVALARLPTRPPVTPITANAEEAFLQTSGGSVHRLRLIPEAGRVEASSHSPQGAALVAVDGRGGLWRTFFPQPGGNGQRLEGFSAEGVVGFGDDVRPFLSAHCSGCHDFETYEAFAPRAQAALSRVQTGDMPRCEGNARCPEERRLTPEQYAVLERWIEEGRLP